MRRAAGWLRGRATVGWLPYAALAAAMPISAAVILWINRDFTFYNDELAWFVLAQPDYDLQALLEPHNTHLIAVTRLIYTTSLNLLGPEYLPLRIVAVLGVLLCAGLFFVLARRRVGALGALPPTLVLLFFGTAWPVVISPLGIPTLYSIAAGLGALIAVEANGRRTDIAAAALVTLSLASHSFGVGFLVGVATSVLLSRDRLRRAWVFIVPLALYGLWWSFVSGDSTTLVQNSNLAALPVFVFDSLGAELTAIAGLNLPGPPEAGFDQPPGFSYAVAPVLAIAAIIALAIRFRRAPIGSDLWVFLAVLATFWLAIGLSAGVAREPTTPRYLFPGAVMLLLVFAAAARNMRPSRLAVGAMFAVATFSVAVNIGHMRDAREFLSVFSDHSPATLAMLELAATHVDPLFRPDLEAPGASPRHTAVSAGSYLEAVSRWGSVASTVEGLSHESPSVRDRADTVLAQALELRLIPVEGRVSVGDCHTARPAEGGETVVFELPAGGALLRSHGRDGGEVALRRFGESFRTSVGQVPPGESAILRVPEDRAVEPWIASATGDALDVCEPPMGTRGEDQASLALYCRLSRQLDRGAGEVERIRREGGPPEEVEDAYREFLARSQLQLEGLSELAPGPIQADVETIVAGLVGEVPDAEVRAAEARVDEYEGERCAGR